jgi:hypothetical protein
MFSVGPSATCTPLPANSAPIAAPYCCSSALSKVAAAELADGIWVTPPSPSPTPCGPSCRPMFGMHSDGMPVMLPMYGVALLLPCRMDTFCAVVICAMTCATRVATGAVDPTQGQLPSPPPGGGVVVPPPAVSRVNSHSE